MIQNKNISPTFIFFFREDQPHSKAKLRPRSLRLHQFCFSSGVALVFFSLRLCMRSYSDSHTPSHAHSQAHTTHPPTLPHMRYASWTPGPAHQGERVAPCWGRFCWRRWTWLLSRVRPFVFNGSTHTCLIAWPIQGGAHRGCRPLESENRRIAIVSDSPPFIITFEFCVLSCRCVSRSLDLLILDVLGDPWQTSVFSFVIWSCFLKATAPITEVTSACLNSSM